jgi:undecaprenyl-diphosphatase
MSYFQAIFLAIVQGLTEFLPLSSSGHLVILQKLFNFSEPPVFFDILVHVGTLMAIFFYFRKSLVKMTPKTLWLIIVGTIPAVIVGLFLQNYLDLIFNSLKLVGFTLLLTSLLLFSTKKIEKNKRQFNQLKWPDALFVGLFQALAILPGLSRSGSTIVAGLWRQFEQETAFQFSFFLAIPAILGALILQIPDLMTSPCSYPQQGFLGMIIAALVGYLSLRVLKKTLVKTKLWFFGFYCLILGLIVLLI